MTDQRPDPSAVKDAWPAPEPSSDFARRVLAEHFADPPASVPTRTRWAWVAAVAAAAILALGLGWALTRPEAVHDELTARRVETVALGERATAVAQPGAHLQWAVESDGTTRIDQSSGRVFYRVDHGERFDVVTPAGTVTVTGTCFAVDLETPSMKSTNIRAGALGAALASALVVTVYEGGVVLANEHGSVDIDAGQAARASETRAPIRFDPDDPSRASKDGEHASNAASTKASGRSVTDPRAHIQRQARDIERIREEKEAQAARIRELEEQVVALGGSVDPKTPEAKQARAKMCASQSRGGPCPFLEPDEETLMEMARCATVKIDSLGFVDNVEPPVAGQYAERLGVTDPAESKKIDAAIAKQYEDYNAQLRSMYLELGGDEETADQASGKTLQSFIFDQLDREMFGDIQRRIAEERAGLREPPLDMTGLDLEERVARMMANDGNEFERLVGEQLGPERARELRRQHDGWPGSTSVHSGDCRDLE